MARKNEAGPWLAIFCLYQADEFKQNETSFKNDAHTYTKLKIVEKRVN
jgi:hypothetical protein